MCIPLAGVALWLVPSQSASHDLRQIMDFRPSQCKSSSSKSYSNFHPHITLASGIPSSVSTTSLLACIPEYAALPVEFKSLEVGETYFRSVFLAIHASPKLSGLHQHINNELKKLDGVEPRSPCFPHLSLFYIDDSEVEERQMVADELLSSGKVVKDGRDRIILNCFIDKHTVRHELSGFDGVEVWIVNCEGQIGQWEALAKVDLAQS
jgi:2',3'-cyclic-nucleotide 3'-phosphodiesterase